MKKILTHLTGIVLIITILFTVGCKHGQEQETVASEEETLTDMQIAMTILGEDSDKVFVFVEDTVIDGKMHLNMFNVKHTGEQGKKVLDSLTTEVQPENTVYWRKTSDAELKKIHLVRIVDSGPWNLIDTCLIGVESEVEEDKKSVKFVIPSTADSGTVKYELIIEDKDKKLWCIDPYLMIR
jgi:hypothetical protein